MDFMDDEPTEYIEDIPSDVQKKECLICDKVLAILGMFLGGFMFAIAIDLITGGKFSQVIDGWFSQDVSEE